MSFGALRLLFLAVCVNLIGVAFADDPKPAETKPAETKPAETKPAETKTETKSVDKHVVKKGLIKVSLSLEGTFEPEKYREILLRPESWTELTVKEAVRHGAKVSEGDVLLRLDSTKLDEAIRDLESEVEISKLGARQTQSDLELLEKTTPLDLAAAERSKEFSDDDLRYFLEVERDLTRKQAELGVKNMSDYLAYSKEELRQLEKMYKADDLTEETEEIILQRQRNEVEMLEFQLAYYKVMAEHGIKVELPRQEQAQRETNVRQNLTLEKAKLGLPVALEKQRLERIKQKRELDKHQEKLALLKKDAELMVIRAKASGTVYYGALTEGAWGGSETLAAKLKQGGSIQANEVVMTIVEASGLHVRLAVPEKDLHLVKRDLAGTVVPGAYPDRRLPGVFGAIDGIPTSTGKFGATFVLKESKPEPAGIVAGMACTVKLIPYQKDDALTAPTKAVFADEKDEDKHFVYLVDGDSKHTRRDVKIGHAADEKTEILEGLAEGDSVLTAKPTE